jgi:hypothetical protein
MPDAVSKLWKQMKTNHISSACAAHRWLRALFAAGTVLLLVPHAPAQTYTVLNAPLGVHGTSAWGVSGNNVVGNFYDSANAVHGFLYNGSSYTTLDDPLAGGPYPYTYAYGVSGSTVAGFYSASSGIHGFLYNSGVYTTFDVPGAKDTYIRGISGNHLVGFYDTAVGGALGYFYNGSTFTTLSDPLAVPYSTTPYAVDGDTVVGSYMDSSGVDRGFIYSGGTYTTLNNPLGAYGTVLTGISGNTIVGQYRDSATNAFKSFVYSSGTFNSLQDPNTDYTWVNGISGNTLVGEIQVASSTYGFITTIPEPSAVAFVGLGAVLWIRARRRTLPIVGGKPFCQCA